jgi:hypothetical protein
MIWYQFLKHKPSQTLLAGESRGRGQKKVLSPPYIRKFSKLSLYVGVPTTGKHLAPQLSHFVAASNQVTCPLELPAFYPLSSFPASPEWWEGSHYFTLLAQLLLLQNNHDVFGTRLHSIRIHRTPTTPLHNQHNKSHSSSKALSTDQMSSPTASLSPRSFM